MIVLQANLSSHDWDSLAWQPEAALAGAASGAFASSGPPVLAPIESSEAFLLAYQNIRGRLFSSVELEIAWAASLWMAAYNAREEAMHGDTPVGPMRSGHRQPNASAGPMRSAQNAASSPVRTVLAFRYIPCVTSIVRRPASPAPTGLVGGEGR